MTTLDMAGIITRVCTDLKEKFASKSELTAKQDKLISGTNIKTINYNSLVGSGNVNISTADITGYQLRTGYIGMTASDSCGSSRIWLTSADGTKMVPINTSTSTSSTEAKTLNTRPIDPFGRIIYYASSGYANSSLYTNNQWDQYHLTIGYSYVKTLTNKLPVYLKCTPQSDGSAVMADIVQALPSTNDGYIYIFLGVAYSTGTASSTTSMELQMYHPVYYHDGTGIRLWAGAEPASGGGGTSYRVDITVSDSSITAVDYNGSTLTEIATLLTDNPSADVKFIIHESSAVGRGILEFSSYNTSWGDIASQVGVISFWYDQADDKFYIRQTTLSGSGNTTSQKRCG